MRWIDKLSVDRKGVQMQEYRNRRTWTRVGLSLLAVGVVGGLAYAAIPGANGVIQGCYDGGGSLKVVDALPCPKGHTPLPWNQQGVKGDKGDTGATGATGAPGAAGQREVFFAEKITDMDLRHDFNIIVDMFLLPGRYVVEGSIELYNNTNAVRPFVCKIKDGVSLVHFLPPFHSVNVRMTNAINQLNFEDVPFLCADSLGNDSGILVTGGTLLATKVDSINGG